MSYDDDYRIIEALAGGKWSAIAASDPLLSTDAMTALHVASRLEREGLIGPSNGQGRHAVNIPAARLWLRVAGLVEALEAEKGNHAVTRVDLQRNINEVKALREAREDAAREVRLAKGAKQRAEDRLAAARRAVRVLVGSAACLAVLVLFLTWVVIA